MTTAATIPTYPVPDRPVQVVFSITANFVQVWCTVAPEGSELSEKLKKTTQNRFLVYRGDGGANNPWRYKFDKGGKYTFVAQEYTRGTAYGGGYEGDPNGVQSETKSGSEDTISIYIGQRMTSPIGVAPDSATLVMWVWNDTIRPTTLAVQGENTPAIIADVPTPRAKSAIEASAVVTALAALKNVAVSTAVGNIATIVSEMVTDLNAHNAAGATTHNAADTANAIKAELGAGPTPANLPEFVNSALLYQRRHRLNDDGAVSSNLGGVGSANYHNTGIRLADFAYMPLYQSVSGMEDGYAALADIWRAHEGHRTNLNVHGTADVTHTLATLPLLLQVHLQFLTVVAALSPSVAPAQSSGATTLISHGFAET